MSDSSKIIDALNRLVALHNSSLAVFLRYAVPAWHPGDEAAREALDQISLDQRETADRLADLVAEMGGVVDSGEFPIIYTGYHDLSFDYLLGKLVAEQEAQIQVIGETIPGLADEPLAVAAAEEALGAAKGHLETLCELRDGASV